MDLWPQTSDAQSMENKNFLELKQTIDQLVSGYQLKQARELLKKLPVEAVPKKLRADFASLARRAGLNKLSIKILHHNIFGTSHPDPKDVVEYSSGLRKLGLMNQALTLLSQIPKFHESHLHKAFCHISCWDYKNAHDDLFRFVNYKDVEPGKKLVGDLNLVSCLIELNRLDEASTLLDSVTARAQEKSRHLYLNCLEFRGQIHIQAGHFEKAKEVLGQAAALSQSEEGTTNLFIEKWHLISRCRDNELTGKSSEIQAFRSKIRRQGHWETLRDFDWQIAKITKDPNAVNYIYYGTPFMNFRNYINTTFPATNFAQSWLWKDTNTSGEVTTTFDIFDYSSVPMPYGMGLHRLCLLLASDLYRPWSVERLFNVLFASEHYNPFSSHKKVYRLLDKLGKALESNDIPLLLQSTDYGYRIRLKPNSALRIYPQMQFDSQESLLKYRLQYLGLESFTIKDVMNKIPLSQHQWYRALKKMENAGLVSSDTGDRANYLVKKAS